MDVKDDDDEDEKLDDKLDLSPWADDDDEDKAGRTIGWRSGTSLNQKDVDEILRKERGARMEYKSLRKAIRKVRQKDEADPMMGLPPAWQAFCSTVPEMDAQAAFKASEKERQRLAQADKKAEREKRKLDWESKPGETLHEEVGRLQQRIQQLREAVHQKEKVSQEWDKKLARITQLNADSEASGRRVQRKLDAARYNYGTTMGKTKSSDTYFSFLYNDTEDYAKKKVLTLNRSCALMDKSMDLQKGYVRQLLKDAAETERRGESSAGDDRKSRGSGSYAPSVQTSASKVPPKSPSLHEV
eukprot:TRINITY_DN68604_c0_g1_i1.p1 TRINITY_DN68604_c0_g1~~TRINITY_DN68604_c0_g1_i1.p1  ORF type:complete len:316 (-),score=71.63 TRINITY_DN68604_c0_g1_i1:43-942(-)